MNKQEAYLLALKELERYESLSFEELEVHLGNNYTSETQVESGVKYQLEVQIFWDSKEQKNVRVMVSVDDMSWFAFSPITESILVKPPEQH